METRPRRAVIIRNPRARRAPAVRELLRAAGPLRDGGWEVEGRDTSAPGEATELAAAAAGAGADVVIACGGDGTVHEVMNGLAGTETALAVAPAGTADVWAREARLPRDPAAAMALLPHARRARMDLGAVNGRHFLLMCGIGLGAEAVRRMEARPRAKRWLGRAAYAAAGVTAALGARAAPTEIAFEGETVRLDLLLAIAGNTRLYGGVARLTAAARIDDGLLDLLTFHTGGRDGAVHRARLALRALRGGLHRRTGGGIDYRRAARVVVTPERALPVQADGEFVGETPVTLTVAPQALTVLIAPRPNPLFDVAPGASGSGE